MTQDNEVESTIRTELRAIGKIIDKYVKMRYGDRMCWLVAMFPYNEGGRFNYMCPGKREDIIVLLKEMLARFEGMPEVPTTRA